MSVRLTFGSLIVSAVIASACATGSGAQPQPFPNLPAPTPVVSANPATPPVPESVVTNPPSAAPAKTATVTGSETTVPLVPLTAPNPAAPDVPVPNPARTSVTTRVTAKRPDAVTKTALNLRGTKYRLGGEAPGEGFDCSGFVHYVFEQHQIDVPRTVAEQFQVGERIAPEDIQKGDLLFFATTGKGATHVGIALGPEGQGEFVHAPGAGGSVRVEHFDAPYWRSKLVGVRRVF